MQKVQIKFKNGKDEDSVDPECIKNYSVDLTSAKVSLNGTFVGLLYELIITIFLLCYPLRIVSNKETSLE